MKRTIWVGLTAAIELLFGLVFFLLAALLLVAVMNFGKMPAAPAPSRSMLYGLSACYAAFGGLTVATAIGMWQMRQSARVVTMICGGLVGLVSALAAAITIIPLPAPDQSLMHAIRVGMTIFWAAVASTGAFCLLVAIRSKELFASIALQRGEIPRVPTKPLSISIIGWFFIFSGVVAAIWTLGPGGHYPVPIFGMMISGKSAAAFQLALNLAYISTGIGLLGLRRLAWVATLCILGFGLVNTLAMQLLPGREARINAILAAVSPEASQASTRWAFSPVFQLTVVLISLGIPAYFLWVHRKTFGRPQHDDVSAD